MLHARFQAPSSVLALALVAFLCISAPAQNRRTATPPNPNANNAAASSQQPEISYTVAMSKPYTHLFEVEMRVRRGRNAGVAQTTDLVMPVWTPGSYLVREYARNVQDFAVKDEGGRSLNWRKINKNTWRIETGAARDIVATYRSYANELTVRTNELNDQHAFWNNAALLMYVDGFLKAPSTLRVVPFGNWKVATGLPAVNGQSNTFRAENFDVLYDSPFEASNFKTISFEVKNVPHRIIIDGEGNYDAERLRRDVQKIVETESALMGEIPYHDYTFILHLRSRGGGGLEHLNSTALGAGRFSFKPETSYKGFLSLVSHEFFHLWNVKRIRPDALGPFDYTQENYTRLLWVAEGFTEYYSHLLLARSGLISEQDYLRELASNIQNMQNTPGRLEQSAEESSFDAWIKFYRPDENFVNTNISYYDKGALLGMLLDLEIRKRSNNTKSLDDVMRYLYTEFYKKNRNYTPEDMQRACELMAGSSLEDFFTRFVRGREELNYNAALDAAGLRLETTGASDGAQAAAEKAFLGANLTQEGERLNIRFVPSGTPAYDQGLNAGDQIVALNGIRVTQETLNARLAEKRPGETVTLTVFRSDDLRTFNIKLGAHNDAPYRITPIAQPSAEQQRTLRGWLGGS
jgi:predicted metalloprotease with PDZ domain